MPESTHKLMAGAIFVVAYAAIASDRIDKTKVALFGAALMLLLGIISQHEAFGAYEFADHIVRDALHRSIEEGPTSAAREAAEALRQPGVLPDLTVPGSDWNTIFLLIGMMMIVGIMRHTGVFQWLAIRTAKVAKGEPVRILVLLSVVTAVLSAGLDNVTTVLLIAPVTLAIADSLRLSPFPFLLCEIMASNIGGTATLIGDPPNIIIASKAGLSFMQFLVNLTPPVVIMMVPFVVVIRWLFRRSLVVTDEVKQDVMHLDESKAIRDARLLWRSLMVMGLVLIGFGVHNVAGWEPATVALCGAALLLLISGLEPEKVFEEIEWPTIFFFLGLFVMVGSLVKVGIIGDISHAIVGALQDNMPALVSVMLWFSAIASAVVDNIPYTMAMAEVVTNMSRELYPAMPVEQAVHQPPMMALWWSLSLGACLGGNGTLVGASANVVVAGIAKRAGHPIGFVQFMKYGIPITLMTVGIAWVYVWVVYLIRL